MDLDTEEREELAYSSQAGREDRSSSLSELGDRADQEQPDRNTLEESDANDTEAETERLEDSPQRQGKHQNIVLTASIGIHNEHRFSLAGNANQDLAVQSCKFETAVRYPIQLISSQMPLQTLRSSSDLQTSAHL